MRPTRPWLRKAVRQCLPPAYTVPTAGVHPTVIYQAPGLSVMPVYSGHFHPPLEGHSRRPSVSVL